MGKYIDWYSVELDGYLKGRLSDVQRFESVKEIQNHFAEHIDDLVEKGMEQMQAEKAAIANFGSPRDAATQLLNHGPRSKFGGYLSSFAAILVVFAIGSMSGYFHLSSLQAYGMLVGIGGRVGLWSSSVGLMAMVVIFGLIAAFLSRKVTYAKYLTTWGIAIIASFMFLLAGPRQYFADVKPSEYPTMHARWVVAHDQTVKLAGLERKIMLAVRNQSDYMSSDEDKFDKEAAKKAILSVAPQMLAINGEYCQVTGKKTTGYLAPKRTSNVDRYYLYSNYGMTRFSAEDEKIPSTGRIFPIESMNLKYVDSADEALAAWQNHFAYNSVFASMVPAQEAFMRQAESMSTMNRAQLAAMTVVPIAIITLLNLMIFFFTGWIVTKVPNMAFRSSFRQVVA